MASVMVNRFGIEKIISEVTTIGSDYSMNVKISITLPKGSIRKLIGRELTPEDEPVELKQDIQ